MLKIDSHQHFWKYSPVNHRWITDDMQLLRKDFLPEDFGPVLEENGFDGCVLVQADQTLEENDFQLQNAERYDFIKGVVGWVDLQAADIREQLERLSTYDKLKGFRHVLQGEQDRALMLKPAFLNGIGKLAQFGFSYDILIFPDQLKYVIEFVKQFPDQRFVLDHIAKPDIKHGKIADWKADIMELAKFENVCCKVSGMVTEADWAEWTPADFIPYLDVIFGAFGTNKVLFGSDWPVCLVAADYTQVLSLMKRYMLGFSESEQQAFWGGNAVKFYNL